MCECAVERCVHHTLPRCMRMYVCILMTPCATFQQYRQVTRELVPRLQQLTESRPIAPQSQESRLCLHLPLRSVHAMCVCVCVCVTMCVVRVYACVLCKSVACHIIRVWCARVCDTCIHTIYIYVYVCLCTIFVYA